VRISFEKAILPSTFLQLYVDRSMTKPRKAEERRNIPIMNEKKKADIFTPCAREEHRLY
jgi:hypothetical protein